MFAIVGGGNLPAGWFLLKFHHKQCGVNVDNVGPDAHIGPLCTFLSKITVYAFIPSVSYADSSP